jgi:hypothetical protein
MPGETLTPQTGIVPPPLEAQPQPASTELVRTKPFYELDEGEIRDKVTAALVEAEHQNAERVIAGDAKQTPLIVLVTGDVNPEAGQIANINKARLMAEAERPYRDKIAAKNLNNLTSELKNPDSLWSLLREPIKVSKAFGKGISRELLEIRAANASTLAGLTFDKIIEATKPYSPQVVISKAIREIADYIDPDASQGADNRPDHETDAAPEAIAAPEKAPGIAEALKISTQYAEQLQIFHDNKLVEQIDDGRLGYVDEHHNVYPVPDREQVEELINKKAELVKEKAGQGFTRLLLVPNGLSDERLADTLNDSIADHVESGNLHDSSGVPVNAKQYNKDPHDSDFISQPDQLKRLLNKPHPVSEIPGWDILLVKNMPETPRNEHEVVVMGGRGEFMVAPRSPKECQDIIATNPFCSNESGFTFGIWATYALTEMARTGNAVDYHTPTLLLDSYEPNSGIGGLFGRTNEVACVGWDKRYTKGKASPVQIQWGSVPPKAEQYGGVRTAVRLS